ncbi:MAG: rod shape-determining protein RodA [Alphaproteobacteria bacterium]
MTFAGGFSGTEPTLREKILRLNWGLVLLVSMIAGIGFAMLYSAANASLEPWAGRQMARFAFGVVLMVGVALVDIRFWLRAAWPFYAINLALLVAVEIIGDIGGGAQRWLDIGVLQLQPSETMKVAVVLALARHFHAVEAEDVNRPRTLLVPLLVVLAPAALVMRQPDLGTAMVLIMVGGAMMWLAGVRLWLFAALIAGAAAAVPVAWGFLREYQKQRVLTFLDPGSDPLGAGYHILQSKIALGSGGLFGKGFLAGTQSHLNFLPEKQTDFIFTMLAEELGLVGALGLVVLYALILAWGVAIALRARSHFARMLAMGLTANFFLYVFVNIAMVMGLVPVVGVPLPLISYGGTAMLAVLFATGLVMSCHTHRNVWINRRGGA